MALALAFSLTIAVALCMVLAMAFGVILTLALGGLALALGGLALALGLVVVLAIALGSIVRGIALDMLTLTLALVLAIALDIATQRWTIIITMSNVTCGDGPYVCLQLVSIETICFGAYYVWYMGSCNIPKYQSSFATHW